jgi:hypothetical protein
MHSEALPELPGVWSNIKVRSAAHRAQPGVRMSVKDLAKSLPQHAWRTITWRQGTNDPLYSRFARVRVHASPTRGRELHFDVSLRSPKCAGASSAIIKSSSRKSASVTTRAVDGLVFIITARFASQLMDS